LLAVLGGDEEEAFVTGEERTVGVEDEVHRRSVS
jgi:hypothetical protein